MSDKNNKLAKAITRPAEPPLLEVVKQSRKLIAYQICASPMRILPAPRTRKWMDDTDQSFANRCLPLLMANQHGWTISAGQTFEAFWFGAKDKGSMKIDLIDAVGHKTAVSTHFGHGIITWQMPWLFRTPPGWNLLVKGPANLPKDGVCYLEGLVETDWNPATFTFNVILTRPKHKVRFEKDEPLCMIVPQQRQQLDEWYPEILPLQGNQALNAEYNTWQASRAKFNAALERRDPTVLKQKWQKDYFQGHSVTGQPAKEHQSKQVLRQFTRG